MTYFYDRFETNPIALADYEESHSARRRLTEVQRAIACGHTARQGRVCPDCDVAVDL